MKTEAEAIPGSDGYALFFASLFDTGRGYAYPCRPDGRALVESFGPKLRDSFERAQRSVGIDLCQPVVRISTADRRRDSGGPG
jgi:hypothetical protein